MAGGKQPVDLNVSTKQELQRCGALTSKDIDVILQMRMELDGLSFEKLEEYTSLSRGRLDDLMKREIITVDVSETQTNMIPENDADGAGHTSVKSRSKSELTNE